MANLATQAKTSSYWLHGTLFGHTSIRPNRLPSRNRSIRLLLWQVQIDKCLCPHRLDHFQHVASWEFHTAVIEVILSGGANTTLSVQVDRLTTDMLVRYACNRYDEPQHEELGCFVGQTCD